MIRVNLLPVRQEKRREYGKQQIVLLALLVVFVGVGNWQWSQRADADLRAKRAQVAQFQQDIAQLEKVIGEVNTISKEMKDLEAKLAVLDELRKGRTGPVKMLDALASTMPERTWLTSMVERDGRITMRGGAVSNEDLGELMSALKENPFFSEPTLRHSTQRGRDGNRYFEFELSCAVNYSA